MGTARVATVHFYPVTVDRRQFGFGVYELPAVPLGAKPAVIEIADKIQTDRGPYQDSHNKNVRSIRKFPETGQVIAYDIVHQATELGLGMTDTCRPGIWRIRESLPEVYTEDVLENGRVIHAKGDLVKDADGTAMWREASEREKAQMWVEDEAAARAADAAYADMLIAGANSMDPKLWRFISPITKAAAKHYNIVADWNTKVGALERIACPHCAEQIVKTAAKCRFCGGIVDAVRVALNDEIAKNAIARAKSASKETVAA
jgi:hypothetical protein